MRKATIIMAIAVLALLVTGVPVNATEELAEAEDLVCTSCHDKPGSKRLTSEGKYYEVMRTLDGYEAVTRVFGSCTSCHKRKPGSTKLTAGGRRFAEIIGDMQGLKELLMMEHPTPPVAASESPMTPEMDDVDSNDMPVPDEAEAVDDEKEIE